MEPKDGHIAELEQQIETLRARVRELEAGKELQRVDSKRLGELAAIVESSDDAIVSKNLDGIITSWNAAAARILGFTAEEMIGTSVLKLIPKHLYSDEEIIIGNVRAGRRVEHFETQRLNKSGQLLDVSLTVSPVRDATGEIVGASKILRDVSGRKRMEASLLQAEKIAATGRMAATIAHEINNPLEAVVNLLYLLRPAVTDPEHKGYLETAESELNRVSHIAKQTLGYYREHASAVQVSLSDLVDQALRIYEPRCVMARIRVEPSLCCVQKIVVRRGEIIQVVSNLIANAIQAMPDGGVLRITIREADDPAPGIRLQIIDNGVGIEPVYQSRVFEAFFTTRGAIGTGIGLFVAKQFIEGHGGQISLTSSTDPATHGTTISVFLPMETVYSSAEGAPAPTASSLI